MATQMTVAERYAAERAGMAIPRMVAWEDLLKTPHVPVGKSKRYGRAKKTAAHHKK